MTPGCLVDARVLTDETPGSAALVPAPLFMSERSPSRPDKAACTALDEPLQVVVTSMTAHDIWRVR
jgi:hypothetical protein